MEKVSQRHRDAGADYARDYLGWPRNSVEGIRAGSAAWDGYHLTQAFARFERDHLTPATQPDVDREAKAQEAFDATRDIGGLFWGELSDFQRPRILRAMFAFADATRPQVSDGYQQAFYAIGDLLALNADVRSPKEVWEQEMLPRLRELIALKQRTQSPQAIPDAQGNLQVNLAGSTDPLAQDTGFAMVGATPVDEPPDEDWLADVIDDSLDMDWTGRVGARAIIAAWGQRHGN